MQGSTAVAIAGAIVAIATTSRASARGDDRAMPRATLVTSVLAPLPLAFARPRVLAHEKDDAPSPLPDASGFHEPPTLHVIGEPPPRSASETKRSRSVVAAAPHRTAGDVLQIVPGVFLTQHSGLGKAYQMFFRGFDSVHGQDVELWAGGAPVNDVSNVHGQGYADLHFVMPEVVSEIRSLPGTYDPRQGDFAIAGTMRLELGFDRPGVTAKTTFGSFGERRYFLAYHPEGAPESTFAAFEAWSTDGFGPSRAARRTSAIGQQVFDLGKGATARVLASGYASRFDSAGVVPLHELESGRIGRFDVLDPKQGGSSSRAQLVLDLGQTEEHHHWSIAPYLVFRALRLRQNFTGFLVDPVNGDSTQQTNDAVTFGATGHYQRKLALVSSNDALEIGFAFRHDRIGQTQRTLAAVDDRVLGTQVDATVLATNASGYVDAALKPFRRITLRGGVRLDGLAYDVVEASGAAKSAHGTHVGSKATLDVRLLGPLHAVGSFGEGFRSPQARSLAPGESAPFTRVRSFELGLRYRDTDAVQASIAAFHGALTEDLIFDPTTARNESVPATRRTGLSAEFVFRPASWFVSSGSATWTRATFAASDARYVEGNVVPFVPPLVVRTDAAFTPTLGRVLGRPLVARFGAATSALSGRPLPYGEMGEGIFLVDATAALRLREIELSLDAFNLLGARWFDGQFVNPSRFRAGEPASLLPIRHVTVGAPRTILLTLTVNV